MNHDTVCLYTHKCTILVLIYLLLLQFYVITCVFSVYCRSVYGDRIQFVVTVWWINRSAFVCQGSSLYKPDEKKQISTLFCKTGTVIIDLRRCVWQCVTWSTVVKLQTFALCQIQSSISTLTFPITFIIALISGSLTFGINCAKCQLNLSDFSWAGREKQYFPLSHYQCEHPSGKAHSLKPLQLVFTGQTQGNSFD